MCGVTAAVIGLPYNQSVNRLNTTVAVGLLRVGKIYDEPAVRGYAQGCEILDRFPGAQLDEVPSHWNIPQLHGHPGGVDGWNKTEKTVLVLGTKKDISHRPFYRSCDFIASSQSNGCAMACSCCYVTRRKGNANPITAFVNIKKIVGSIERHSNLTPISISNASDNGVPCDPIGGQAQHR